MLGQLKLKQANVIGSESPSPKTKGFLLASGGSKPPSDPDNGTYWVKRRGSAAWVPAKLFEGFWQFIGEIAMFPSDDIAQIGPRLIPPTN